MEERTCGGRRWSFAGSGIQGKLAPCVGRLLYKPLKGLTLRQRFAPSSVHKSATVEKQDEAKIPNRTTWPEWAQSGKVEWSSLESTDEIHIVADKAKRDAVKQAFAVSPVLKHLRKR